VVHFSFAVAVAAAAALLHMDRREWYVLLLCITVVLTAETFNSALESMARAITREQNAHLRDALDIGSAAVLVAAIGAALIGILVFVHRAMEMIG
jgi:diacylglycerol kinase